MRRNFTRILAAVAASLAVLSCAKANLEEAPLNLLPNQYVATFESTEGDGAPATKVSLASDNTSVTWDKGDIITFVAEGKTNAVSRWRAESLDQNGKRAVLELYDGSADAPAKFAIYPHNLTDNRITGQSLVCWSLANQSGTFKDANVMAAKVVDQTLNFKQAMGIFEFKVTDSKVKKITVECNGIAGGTLVTFGTSDKDRNITKTESYNALDKITVDNVTSGTWYVAVRPGTYDAGSININYLDDKDAVVTSVAYPKLLTVHRKDIIAFGDISEHTSLSGTLPDGKTFNNYMKQLAGELKNITWIQFSRYVSNPNGDIKIAEDVYMSYSGGGISITTSASQFQANEDCSEMFYHCWNLESIHGLSYLNTSATTDMSDMFSNCYKLVSVEPTDRFTTANVTNMCMMFYECEKLEELDLTTFDTRKVTNMGYMFEWCYALNKVFLGNNFVIQNGCFTDESLFGCGATFYGTTAEMESFNSSGIDEAHTIKFAIDMDDAGWWSAWNIGAEKPSDYGYYYSWGNSAGHWKNGTSDGYSFTESAYKSTSGYSMTTDWTYMPSWSGGLWRVPGKSDFENLKKACNISRTTKNGVSGTLFQCKNNGNEIFLPDAGRVFDSGRISGSFYWTRENSNTAVFDNQNAVLSTEDASHFIGYPLRPIAKLGDVAVTGVSLNKDSETLIVWDATQLTATITPSNATIKSVTWTSSDTSVATVSSTGVVTGVSAGTATITATADGGVKKATCFVSVKNADPLPGVFSVSASKKVRFSRANLQAMWDGAKWAINFAVNQYDCLGDNAKPIYPETKGCLLDLFGWSTSANYYGVNSSTENEPYAGTFVDWGTALDDNGTWFTLSLEEWQYLFSDGDYANATRSGRYADHVTVAGYQGCVVLYPDGYTGDIVNSRDNTSYNTIEKWAVAEAAGAVCLPAAGRRSGYKDYNYAGDLLNYWTSTASTDTDAYQVMAYNSKDGVNCAYSTWRCRGCSVRLVTEVK